jgi:hypothetical protein
MFVAEARLAWLEAGAVGCRAGAAAQAVELQDLVALVSDADALIAEDLCIILRRLHARLLQPPLGRFPVLV